MTPDPTPSDLTRLREDEALLPPAPWELWTSCSFRRITGPDGVEGGVLHAYNQRSDNHPDLSMPEEQLFALVRLRNALPGLLDALSSERTARQEAEARAEAAERERDELRLDITGGEDAPGHNASLSHQTIRDILAENYRSWRDSSDRYVTASDQLAAAREALEPLRALFAKLVEHFWSDECTSMDGADFQDWGVETGAVVRTTYDPIRHGDHASGVYGMEPGDEWYEPAPAIAALRTPEQKEEADG